MKTSRKTRTQRRSIGNALFPRIRRQLLTQFLRAPERRYYPGEIARVIDTSLPPVRHELQILSEIGILNSVKEGQHQYYWANTDCMIYPELSKIMIKTFGVADLVKSALIEQINHLRVAFLYGSIATDTDTAKSDIDLIVIGGLSFRKLTTALHKIEGQLGRQINPTLYSEAEFSEKFESGNHFVRAIWDAEKIFIIGTEDDIAELAEQRLDHTRRDKSK